MFLRIKLYFSLHSLKFIFVVEKYSFINKESITIEKDSNDLKKNDPGLKKTLEEIQSNIEKFSNSSDIKKLHKIHEMVFTNAHEIDNIKKSLKSQNPDNDSDQKKLLEKIQLIKTEILETLDSKINEIASTNAREIDNIKKSLKSQNPDNDSDQKKLLEKIQLIKTEILETLDSKINEIASINAREIDNFKELSNSQNLIIRRTEKKYGKILDRLKNMNENFKSLNIETKIDEYGFNINYFIERVDKYLENSLNVQNLLEIIKKQGEKINKISDFIDNHKHNQGCKNPTSPTNGDNDNGDNGDNDSLQISNDDDTKPITPPNYYIIKPIFTRYLCFIFVIYFVD